MPYSRKNKSVRSSLKKKKSGKSCGHKGKRK